MARSGKDSFWSRFLAAAQAMENQHAEQADIRLTAIEREIAQLNRKGLDGRDPVTQPTIVEDVGQSTRNC